MKLAYRDTITSEIITLNLLAYDIPLWPFILRLLGEFRKVSFYRYVRASVKHDAK